MKRRLAALLVLPLVACAAHNSHRVPIDLNADLAPLIDEAWANMEEAWGQPVPLGGTPVRVVVEGVDVQWLPFSPEVPPGGSTIPQPEMQKTIEDVLRPPSPAPVEDPQRCVRVELATDLTEPNALEIQVECALLDTIVDGVLARGRSTIVHFERLYCHGCRERWYGHGTDLSDHPHGGDVAGSAGVGFLFAAPNCSSPGYTKH